MKTLLEGGGESLAHCKHKINMQLSFEPRKRQAGINFSQGISPALTSQLNWF